MAAQMPAVMTQALIQFIWQYWCGSRTFGLNLKTIW
jgi:hypothetical protein